MIQTVRSLAEGGPSDARAGGERTGGEAMSARLRPHLIEAVEPGIAHTLEPALQEADRG